MYKQKIKIMIKIHSTFKKAAVFQLFIMFLLSSCTETINFDAELTEPKLVVHSYITVGEPISAIIRESKFFLNDTTQHEFVKDAEVSVYVNGQYVEKLIMKSNHWMSPEVEYKGNYLPKLNDKIKLVVKRTGNADVYAETQIESPIEIIKIDTVSTDITYAGNLDGSVPMHLSKNFILNFNLQFNDDGNKKNYYRLIVERREVGYRNTWESVTIYPQKIESKDLNTIVINPLESTIKEIWGGGNSDVLTYNIFKDDLFNSKVYNLKFLLRTGVLLQNPAYTGEYNNFFDSEKVIYRIYIQSISKDFYEYMASLSALANTNPFFSEAVQIKSNIVGGIGILGAYTNSNIVEFEFVEY